jgi:hypothetical protein
MLLFLLCCWVALGAYLFLDELDDPDHDEGDWSNW